MLFLTNWFSDAAYNAFRTLCAALCETLYPAIALSYKLFMDLATFRLLGSNTMTGIYSRITMILTIVMVFYITFEFVKYVVEPDNMTDKEKGISKLPQRMLAVVALIAFIPNIFTYLYNIQNAIVKNETITKIILKKTYTNNNGDSKDYDTFGNNFAWQILNTFYKTDSTEDCDGIPCNMVVLMNQKELVNEGSLSHMTIGINSMHEENNESGKIEVSNITFKPLWAVLVGGFIAYMLILYCVDVGARAIQMVYLEFTAPIAIVGILSPKKDGIFQKWLKQLVTTYLDIFIRLIIVNFVFLISEALILNVSDIGSTKSNNSLVVIALILGLLVFAKRVPKMLSELFPSQGSAGGNFGLKPGDRNLGRVLGAALGLATGTVAGAATGLVQGARAMRAVDPKDPHARRKKAWAALTGGGWGAIRGTVGGAGRGLWNGAKEDSNKGFGKMLKNSTTGAKSQFKSNKIYGNKQENGYTLGEQLRDKTFGAFGASYVEEQEKKKAPKERLAKERQSELDSGKKTGDKAFENATAKGKGYGKDARITRAVDKYNKVEQRERDLQDPNSALRAEYSAGKVRHDKKKDYEHALKERNDAISAIDTEAYKNSLDENSLGLDKTKFNKSKTEKVYDSQAHEAAKSQYMRNTGIIGADGKPMQTFDEEAWNKDKDKFTKDRQVEEFDQQSYDAAVAAEKERKTEEYKQRETNRITQEFENKVKTSGMLYTAESAEAELAIRRAELAQEKKAAKDEVQFAYEDWALQDNGSGGHNDDELYRWRSEDDARMEFYNRSATGENQVNKEAEVARIMADMQAKAAANIAQQKAAYATENGISIDDIPTEVVAAIEENNHVYRAAAEDKWRKEFVSNEKTKAQIDVDDANAAIEAYKRKTSGSTDKK